MQVIVVIIASFEAELPIKLVGQTSSLSFFFQMVSHERGSKRHETSLKGKESSRSDYINH